MRIDPRMAPSPEQLENEIGIAIEQKGLDEMKMEGDAAVKLIDNAGVNRPLSEGPIGRTINIGV